MNVLKLKTLIIGLLLFTNVSGQPTNSIPKFTDYNETIGGKVASYVTKEYEVRDYFGEIVKTDSLPIYQNSHFTSFDTLGRIVLYEHRHKDSVLSAVSYKYNDLKMTITQTVYEQGIWNSQYIRVYDSEKFIVSETTLQLSDSTIYRKRIYTRNSIEVQEYDYDSEGDLNTVVTYLINDSGNIIERKVFDSLGNLLHSTTSKYDVNGREINSQSFYNGRLSHSIQTEYMEDAIKRKMCGYGEESEGCVTEMKYFDQYGNVVKTIQNLKNESFSREETYHYDFDSKGNWVRYTHFKGFEPAVMVEREIIYYD